MTRLLASFWYTIWLTLCSTIVLAEQVDIYRAETLVASQSAAERNKAARSAMRDVIIRVSGDVNAPEQPAIRTAINQAHSYLLEFSYASTDKRLEKSDGTSVPATLLVARFSPQGIERLLREAHLPLWPASRPKLLVWSVSRDPAGALHRVPDDVVLDALYKRATLRGLPLLLPQHDFEDNIALPSDSLWSFDEAAIKEASERYRPDAILAGRYSQADNGQWQASWQLIHASGTNAFDDQAGDAASLFSRALDSVADSFASLYAIVPRESGPDVIVMRVENVADFGAHKNLQRYLEGLAMVGRLELLEAEGQQQLLRLYIEGDQALLLTTLELGKRLHPLAAEPVAVAPTPAAFDQLDVLNAGLPPALTTASPGSINNPLVYRWQP